MSQLVRYRMRQRYAIVLVDTARLVRPTHASNICNAQRGATRVRANILSCDENGDVMVLRIIVFLRIQCPLPSENFVQKKEKARRLKDFNVASTDEPSPVHFFLPAKTFQCCRGDFGHIQILLSVFFVEQNDFDDHNMHGIANCRIFVER
jgi:hypothetical protein